MKLKTTKAIFFSAEPLMVKQFLKGYAGLLLGLVCSGCAGSTFLYGDDAPQGKFPSLHSVPDRPTTLRSQDALDVERRQIEKNHHDALDEAQELRQLTGTEDPQKGHSGDKDTGFKKVI